MVRKASEVVDAIDDAVEVEDGDADDGGSGSRKTGEETDGGERGRMIEERLTTEVEFGGELSTEIEDSRSEARPHTSS